MEEASLHPPALWLSSTGEDDGSDDAAAGIPWVLLDLEGYVADHRNRTTAFALSQCGKQVQVTFFLARPPRVSYFCAFCPGHAHTEIPIEPMVLAMEGNLVLLRIAVGHGKTISEGDGLYIYQANGADHGGAPSLKLLPRPPVGCVLYTDQVGLLRYSNRDGGGGKDEFVVAALCMLCEPGVSTHLQEGERIRLQYHRQAVFVYDSKLDAWRVNIVSLDEQQQQKQPGSPFVHLNSKVIAIGGEAGTMAFVDLWQGILLCDVLSGNPELRYVTMPPSIKPGKLPMDDARLFRDIAVVGDRIVYVEMRNNRKPVLNGSYNFTFDGWKAKTWSMPVAAAAAAAASSEEDWSVDCDIVSSDDIVVDDNPHFELLPKVQDSEGRPMPPFKALATCHPALSLNEDDTTVYLMIKIDPEDSKAWVIAVNMSNKELSGVAEFPSERIRGGNFAYVHSRISKHLTGIR
ncbi:hypothetical protein ACP70R_033913 [Stipagrostis hirtigluma subsp. patula]